MNRRGGLYSSFVASGSNDYSENRPYRGAEIPPPTNLNSTGRTERGPKFVPPNQTSTGNYNAPTPGLSKHGYVPIVKLVGWLTLCYYLIVLRTLIQT
jgi:hypothetical protein